MKAALLLASLACAATGWDVVGTFLARGLSQEESEALARSIEVLAKTSTGRKILAENGLDLAGPFDLETFKRRGIVFQASRFEMSAWATARPAVGQYFSKSPNTIHITISPRVLRSPEVLQAPAVLHELVHASDQRKRLFAPSERRGYLLQIHTLIELDDQGLLPRQDTSSPAAVDLLLNYRQLMRVYRGLPLPLGRFGPLNWRLVHEYNEYRARNPGLRSLLAHVELKIKMGDPVGPWDTAENPSEQVKAYYKSVEDEDYLFLVVRPMEAPGLAEGSGQAPGSREAKVAEGSGMVPGSGQAQAATTSLERKAVMMAEDICRSGDAPILSWQVAEKWPHASAAIRAAVKSARDSHPNACAKRVLAGVLSRTSFTAEDLLAFAKEPQQIYIPPDESGGKPERPKRCFKFGIWTKEEYCF